MKCRLWSILTIMLPSMNFEKLGNKQWFDTLISENIPILRVSLKCVPKLLMIEQKEVCLEVLLDYNPNVLNLCQGVIGVTIENQGKLSQWRHASSLRPKQKRVRWTTKSCWWGDVYLVHTTRLKHQRVLLWGHPSPSWWCMMQITTCEQQEFGSSWQRTCLLFASD